MDCTFPSLALIHGCGRLGRIISAYKQPRSPEKHQLILPKWHSASCLRLDHLRGRMPSYVSLARLYRPSVFHSPIEMQQSNHHSSFDNHSPATDDNRLKSRCTPPDHIQCGINDLRYLGFLLSSHPHGRRRSKVAISPWRQAVYICEP